MDLPGLPEKIKTSIFMAQQTESLISKQNSRLILPLQHACEKSNEKSEFNDYFLNELQLLKNFLYPKDISKVLRRKWYTKRTHTSKNESSFCRAGIISLFLTNNVSEQNLQKYVRTNISLTNKEKDIFKYTSDYAKLISYLINTEKLENKAILSEFFLKNGIFSQKIMDVEKAISYNDDIETIYEKWEGTSFLEFPFSLFLILKYKNDYLSVLKRIRKYHNKELMFSYGLMYGLLYEKIELTNKEIKDVQSHI